MMAGNKKYNKNTRSGKEDKREDYGFIPLSGYSREMRLDAVRQAKTAFQNGREQIYLAMTVLYDVMAYARDRGLTALADREYFMEEGPYVLDEIMKQEGCIIPLQKYLELGLKHISIGEEPKAVEELMANRYYANNYAAEDAFTACIYCMGIVGMAYGVCYNQLLNYFFSFIPDEEELAFNEFAEEKKKREDEEKYQQMCRSLEEKFEVWDANRDSLHLDKNSLMTTFNELFGRMNDECMKKLLTKISNLDICYSMLGANGGIRKRVMGLLSERHRFILMEDLMTITFGGDAGEKCMESVGRIIKVWTVIMNDVLEKTE